MPFSEVVVLEGLAVSGGYLKEPVWVPSLEFEGFIFLRLRQYDDWIHKLVCNQSRRASPLAQCGLWQKLLAASCGADALPVDDPLADIMKTMEDPSLEPAKKRPRPRQRAVRQTEFWQDHQKSQRRVRRIEYQGDAGSSDKQSFTILQHVQHCRKMAKTVWLQRDDLPNFVHAVYQETHKKEPIVFTVGIRWLEGIHAWVAKWRDEGGEQTHLAYVLPHKVRAGQKVPIEESAFQEKKQSAKKEFLKRMVRLGYPEESG